MPATSPTLRAVLDGKLCSGCGLCAGVSGGAVEMVLSPPGFLRPRQSRGLSDAQEASIAMACPGIKAAPWDRARAPETHMAWGPYRQVLTGNSTDAQIRHVGSSGGMLTTLAGIALTEGLVDAVATIRAGGSDRPLANELRIVTDPDELLLTAGSRYGPSSPLSTIDDLLEDGRRFLFIGKPCDVSALSQLGVRDERVAERIPFALSFFCGGVPSLKGSEAVIAAMGMEPSQVTAFRYRGNGWPGKARAETADGQVAEMDYATCWGGHLSKHVQFRCKICPDAVGGAADIACADAWFGGESGYPQFDEADGRSLVMVRTAAGQKLLEVALASGAISVEPTSIADVDLMQPSQRNRKTLVSARTLALPLTFHAKPDFGGVMVKEAARHAPLRNRFKNFLGTSLRIIKGRQ